MGTKKYVYLFGGGTADGHAGLKNLLGGKGANLAEMARIGIPVPAGFTITTEVCTYYYDYGKTYPKELEEQVKKGIEFVEKVMGAKFADPENPLLVSVRSGARVSMPGMMDTVLNLGLNDETVEGLIKKTNNPRFGYDSYRRFIQMYANVVKGLDSEVMESVLEKMKEEKGAKTDTDLTAEDLKELVEKFKVIYKEHFGEEFPFDPWEQLWGAIGAVFGSWMNQRAIVYRRLHGIPEDWGTAVNIVAMVYGNMGEDSATGVAFTRDPSTGEKQFYGEWLKNAQGEDVVAGIRTPQPLNEYTRKITNSNLPTLEEEMPEVYKELVECFEKLERHYRDMQDMEFTIQQKKLWFLQTRTGKRTAAAAVKIAVDMVKEGLISKEEAVLRIEPSQLDQLLHPMFDPKAKKQAKIIAKGLNASPGAAVGKVVFTADDAVKWAKNGEKVILVRIETSPEDIEGMHMAQGILTARGGMTSHAAVVARGMGKCCVAGCGDIVVNYEKKEFVVKEKGVTVKEGDYISIDGSTGEVMLGEVPTIEPDLSGNFGKIMEWADEFRLLGVRTNADTPEDAKRARKFGAEGIGLCRTEHMFFAEERILAVRQMIVAETQEEREKALEKILPMQKEDFIGIFKAMEGLPVTIRLLDPPLHEFVPHEDEQIKELAQSLGISFDTLKAKIESLKEFNPMLGHRGCRLGITYPEITRMQARAIMEAACELTKQGIKVLPEIMVPLVGNVKEFIDQKKIIVEVAEEVQKKYGVAVDYKVGTMIEVPRAALTADEVAKEAEFFSFGTNDLTQMTMGFSRDDAGKFLPLYVEKGFYANDPFQSLDIEGVGQLVEMGIRKGRSTREDLKVGICGEHGGDPKTIDFCFKVGMNYVSCSPFRVPIARLAAAHASIKFIRKNRPNR